MTALADFLWQIIRALIELAFLGVVTLILYAYVAHKYDVWRLNRDRKRAQRRTV